MTKLVSIQEVRLLSELAKALDGAGISPGRLAELTGIPRATVYVLLRRLAERDYVTSRPAPPPPGAVAYRLTAAGKRARAQFGKATGFPI